MVGDAVPLVDVAVVVDDVDGDDDVVVLVVVFQVRGGRGNVGTKGFSIYAEK